MSPQVVKAARSVHEPNFLSIEQGDTIVIIDGRPELKYFKGQNQRTFEIGVFPRQIIEKTKHTNSDLIRTMYEHKKNALHTGSAFGFCWGGAGMVASSYSDFQGLEQKPRKGISARDFINSPQSHQTHAKERRSVVNKQFSYNKLINEQFSKQSLNNKENKLGKSKSRGGPVRPPPPNQHNIESQTGLNGLKEGILIDLTPMETSLNSDGNFISSRSPSIGAPTSLKHLGESSSLSLDNSFCILDAPIDIPTEGEEYNDDHQNHHYLNHSSIYTNGSQQNTLALSSNLSNSDGCDVVSSASFNYEACTPRLAPPPYQMPPTYSNTIEMSSTASNHRSQKLDGTVGDSSSNALHYTNVLRMNQQHEQIKT